MAGVSRESLRQRFQATLGRSPKEEIERIRSQNLCEKLRWTELPLEVIAEENGFAGPAEICRFIKRMTGKTPGAIRREQKQ
jgi:LacI family transcriptional regulator